VNDGARTRTIRWSDPMAGPEILRTMSGLEALRAVVRGEVPAPPIAELMGFRLVEADEGIAVFEGIPAEYHYNPIGFVHGGFALTMLDSALGCAVHSTLPAGVGYTTTDVQARFIRGITKDTGVVRASAKAIHVGRSTGIAEARLTDASGNLLAFGTTACAIFR
jgi:uncharacterized protein (TIGR00369 family)